MDGKRGVASPVAAPPAPWWSRVWVGFLCRGRHAPGLPAPKGGPRLLHQSMLVWLLTAALWLAGVSLGPAIIHEMTCAEALRSKTLADHTLALLAAWLAAAACIALWTHGADRGVSRAAAYGKALARALALQSPALLLALTALLLESDPARILKRLAMGAALALGAAGVVLLADALPAPHRVRRGLLWITGASLAAVTVTAAYTTWRGDPDEWRRQTEYVLSDSRLDAVLAGKAAAIIEEVNARSDGTWWLGAYEGWRSAERQAQLLAEGRSTVAHSRHQDGRAVDLVFWTYGRGWSWEPDLPWHLVGEAARARGLTSGYYWRTFRDPPHVELPGTMPAQEGGG